MTKPLEKEPCLYGKNCEADDPTLCTGCLGAKVAALEAALKAAEEREDLAVKRVRAILAWVGFCHWEDGALDGPDWAAAVIDGERTVLARAVARAEAAVADIVVAKRNADGEYMLRQDSNRRLASAEKERDEAVALLEECNHRRGTGECGNQHTRFCGEVRAFLVKVKEGKK